MLLRVILAVEPVSLRRQLVRVCKGLEAETEVFPLDGEVIGRIARASPDVVILNRRALGETPSESVQFLRKLPDPPAIFVLDSAEISQERARLLAAGCDAVLNPTLPVPQLGEVLASLLQKRRAQLTSTLRPERQVPSLSDFVSNSPVMQAFMDLVKRIAGSDASLLILGETGVGKEHLARAIHAEGPRRAAPFIAINCAALPETLLETELFGHEEGAFTGAIRRRRGSFELAHHGTLFLDEIGEMPLHLQVKLLRALQERQIQRLGGERLINVDVRVMASTNRDVAVEVQNGRFRQDLFFRLSVVTLTVPALRERLADLPALATSCINYLRPRVGRPVTGITAEAMEALQRYSWPGNVRELINVLERAMLLSAGSDITRSDLPRAVQDASIPARADIAVPVSANILPPDFLHKPWREVRHDILQRNERLYLQAILRDTGGRIGETARRAGMTPRSLNEKMRLHGLLKQDFRSSPHRNAA